VGLLDLDALDAAAWTRNPFGFLIVPAFLALVEELRGPEMTRRIAVKSGVDLERASTRITLRGRVQRSGGSICTDSWTKIIPVLLYFNDAWACSGGRLRMLRSPTDIEDHAAEVAPLCGTLLAFRRSECSYHGHKPIERERRVLPMSWLRPSGIARMARHVKRATTRARRRLPVDRESNVADS
jgi:hypothetical protein